MDTLPTPVAYASQIASALLNPLSTLKPHDVIDDIKRMHDSLTGLPYTYCVFLWRSIVVAKAVIDDIAVIHSDPNIYKGIMNSLLAAACWWDSARIEYESADDPTCANILVDAGADIRVGIAAATVSGLSGIRRNLKRRHKHEMKSEQVKEIETHTKLIIKHKTKLHRSTSTDTESEIINTDDDTDTDDDIDDDTDTDDDNDTDSELDILDAAQFLQKSNITLPHFRTSVRYGFTIIPPFAASILDEASYDMSLPGDKYPIPIGKLMIGSSGIPQFEPYPDTRHKYSEKCCFCLHHGDGVFLTSCYADGDGHTSLCNLVVKPNSPWQRNVFVFHDKLEPRDILGESIPCHRSCLLSMYTL